MKRENRFSLPLASQEHKANDLRTRSWAIPPGVERTYDFCA